MFQVCVPETGKQEVSMPLGISESSIEKSLETAITFFTMCLMSMHVASKEKSNTLYFYSNPNHTHIIYSIRFALFICSCFSALINMNMQI